MTVVLILFSFIRLNYAWMMSLNNNIFLAFILIRKQKRLLVSVFFSTTSTATSSTV